MFQDKSGFNFSLPSILNTLRKCINDSARESFPREYNVNAGLSVLNRLFYSINNRSPFGNFNKLSATFLDCFVWFLFFTASEIGAAPEAWIPIIFGKCSVSPNVLNSLKPFQAALMLPAFPTGITMKSGTSSSWSQTSKARVFCPSILKGFTEFRR